MRTGAAREGGDILVELIERHELAAAYLLSVLSRCVGFRCVRLGPASPPSAGETPTIAVIDCVGLLVPMSERLRTLRCLWPRTAILTVGPDYSRDTLQEWFSLGVEGFVPFARVEEELEAAVRALAAGRTWIKTGMLSTFRSDTADYTDAGHRGFSEKERLVIGLLGRRLSNKEISAAMGISESTVKFHLANIFEKLGAHDRHAAVELAKARVRASVEFETQEQS